MTSLKRPALQLSVLLTVSRLAIHAFTLTVPVSTTMGNVRDTTTALLMAKSPKKKDKKKISVSATKKGFGAPPLSLEEVAAEFRTRAPRDPDAVECPCGDGTSRSYASCCRPFHVGEAYPDDPREVLRSRYVAFSYRLPLPVMDTTHPTCRDFRTDRVAWAKSLHEAGMFNEYEFVALEDVGDVDRGAHDDEAFLDFKVRMRKLEKGEEEGELEGEVVLAERSRFLRDGDPLRWTYASGEVRTKIAGIDDVVLNP